MNYERNMAIMKFLSRPFIIVVSLVLLMSGCVKLEQSKPNNLKQLHALALTLAVNRLCLGHPADVNAMTLLYEAAMEDYLQAGFSIEAIRATIEVSRKDIPMHVIFVSDDNVDIYYKRDEEEQVLRHIRKKNGIDSISLQKLLSDLAVGPNVIWKGDSRLIMYVQILNRGEIIADYVIDSARLIWKHRGFRNFQSLIQYYLDSISEIEALERAKQYFILGPVSQSQYFGTEKPLEECVPIGK